MNKKLIYFLIFSLSLILLCSCKQYKENTKDQIYENNDNNLSDQPKDNDKQEDISEEKSTNTISINDFNNRFSYKKDEIEGSAVRYTSGNGRKLYENILPGVIRFDNNAIYYQKINSGERTSTQEFSLHSELVTGEYLFPSNESNIIGSIGGFRARYNVVHSTCNINEDTTVITMCKSNGDGLLYLIVAEVNIKSKQIKEILSVPVGNVVTYVKAINDKEYIVFYYAQNSPEVYNLEPTIVKINSLDSSISTIYHRDKMNWNDPTSTKDIWAIDTYDNKIYTIMHQLIEGKMNTFLVTFDKDGNELNSTLLTQLQEYESIDDTIESLTVLDKYIFAKYSTTHKGKAFEILKEIDGNYVRLDFKTERYPKDLISKTLLFDRYCLFTTYSSSDTTVFQPNGKYIFIFDTWNEEAYLFDTEIDTNAGVFLDGNGNILIEALKDGFSSKWIVISLEEIS